ncbi:MAG: hypothetical protein PHQ12_04745 [Chthoniobacteraceae bacterium]|nr:hypothetical protein [Chthoniobacteraceae bacterium]
MSWQVLTADAVPDQSNPAEAAAFVKLQGKNSVPSVLAAVVAEIRDDIRAGGYPLDTDETKLPFGLHNDAINIIRWRILISAPQLKLLQTEARSAAAERSEKKLERISAQKWAPEPPDAASTARASSPGTWNSESKIIMRTHPTPPPSMQFPSGSTPNAYANPDAPQDN